MLRAPGQTPTTVLVLGGVAGAASAGAILWAGLRNCSECDPTPILVSVLWEGAAVSIGVHFANRGRGNLAAGKSYGIEAIGIIIGAIASNVHSNVVGFVIGGSLLAWQIAVAVQNERSNPEQPNHR